MPAYPNATPKTGVGELFREQLMKLKDFAKQAHESIINEKPPWWYRPKNFDADLFQIQEYHPPFLRDEYEEWFQDVVKDPMSPGTVTDLTILSLQGDWLHAMERAFRCRHHTSVRNRIHPSARRKGHGDENGAIQGGLLAYIENLDTINKGEYE